MWRLLAFLLFLPGPLRGQGALRVALYSAELSRDGPGLLYRDLRKGEDPALLATLAQIAEARADVLLLCGIDWDHDRLALHALADALAAKGGPDYPHRYAARPNSGRATGLDLDGDGRAGGHGDAQGFGAFAGQAGMALLSRLPVREAEVSDHTGRLWRDLPGGLAPPMTQEAAAVRRLSTTGHWVVPLDLPGGGRLTILAYCAGPPAFGRGDENIRRNHDETAFWTALLDGAFGPPPAPPFVLMGNAALDPLDGSGRHEAIARLLSDPRFEDMRPEGPWPEPDGQRGDPRLDTVDWSRLRSGQPGPGRLRADYVLPSRGIGRRGAVLAPHPATGGRHGVVVVDLDPDLGATADAGGAATAPDRAGGRP